MKLSISIVSHGQIMLVFDLIKDIELHCKSGDFEIILTLNIHEDIPWEAGRFKCPIKFLVNDSPKGFSCNHNSAFTEARGEFFCILNPDIRIHQDPFPVLLRSLKVLGVFLVAPVVLDVDGNVDDSFRKFPTPLSILVKFLGFSRRESFDLTVPAIYPDWVGGMFMLLNSSMYTELNGFDSSYFLYYEDVDLCARIRISGGRVAVIPAATVTHLARRDSHKNVKYLKWHITSMFKFFFSKQYLKLLLCR